MSNANKPSKVLRVALRRIQKGWTKSWWSERDKQTGVTKVCLEGAIFGYKNDTNNPACKLAKQIVIEVLNEQYNGKYTSIPRFNDADEVTFEMAESLLKAALIRSETGGLLRDTEEECWS